MTLPGARPQDWIWGLWVSSTFLGCQPEVAFLVTPSQSPPHTLSYDTWGLLCALKTPGPVSRLRLCTGSKPSISRIKGGAVLYSAEPWHGSWHGRHSVNNSSVKNSHFQITGSTQGSPFCSSSVCHGLGSGISLTQSWLKHS